MILTNSEVKRLEKLFNLEYCYIERVYQQTNVKLSFGKGKVFRKNNRTTVVYCCVLRTPVITCQFKVVGRANCAANDTFDETVGFRIADDRAVQKAYKKAGNIIESLKLLLSSTYDTLNAGLRKCDKQFIHARVMESEVIKSLEQ